MSIKDAMTYITISVTEYKKLLRIEQRMEVIKSMVGTDAYFSGDDLRKMIGVKKEGEE